MELEEIKKEWLGFAKKMSQYVWCDCCFRGKIC